MRYNQIRSLDVSNAEGVGIALFVQGCHFRCDGCFNQETWDFNKGKEWTKECEKRFLELADKPYISHISILGGEPLAEENINSILELLKKIRIQFGDNKAVWLYTGYKVDFLEDEHFYLFSNVESVVSKRVYSKEPLKQLEDDQIRNEIIQLCDVVVDGRFEVDKKDLYLLFRGSSNQRLINIKETLENGEIILWH